ncbi:transmembrane protein, putative [Medicago truncatula]|uniref:Transmembrane protein, putative n=1 Tax=Medicago truncatula TaxID=3880 RepID=A0A072TYK1_MEDTR|nr:transmembrane protein, putative [Medicago truncatula]
MNPSNHCHPQRICFHVLRLFTWIIPYFALNSRQIAFTLQKSITFLHTLPKQKVHLDVQHSKNCDTIRMVSASELQNHSQPLSCRHSKTLLYIVVMATYVGSKTLTDIVSVARPIATTAKRSFSTRISILRSFNCSRNRVLSMKTMMMRLRDA